MRCGARIGWAVAFASLAVQLVVVRGAEGDGGVVQLSETVGDLLVTVFTAPTPLRAGPIDVSVMVQERDAQRPILDAAVSVVLRSRAGDATLRAAATREQATNMLLYAAIVDLPAPGDWDLEVTVDRAGRKARVVTGLSAAAPVSPLLSFWPYLAFPPALIALFALHQWLDGRRAPREPVLWRRA